MRGKNQSRVAVRYLRQNEQKLLLGNAGSNEKNNCKPDHSRSELLCHWLVKDKLSKSFLIFKINEIKAAPLSPHIFKFKRYRIFLLFFSLFSNMS
jgi:hypothetical protein